MGKYESGIVLKVDDLYWLGEGDGSSDLCAHGSVEVKIGNDLLSDVSDKEWCVSAASLYLLRTLTSDHTREAPVGEHLIPHCGHAMFKEKGKEDVVIIGCGIGIDWEVRHRDNVVALQPRDKKDVEVLFSLWVKLVCGFADDIRAFVSVQADFVKLPADFINDGTGMPSR